MPPRTLTERQIKSILLMDRQNYARTTIAERMAVTLTTVSRVINEDKGRRRADSPAIVAGSGAAAIEAAAAQPQRREQT